MTTPDTSIESILAAAVELPTPAERHAYIAQACGGDTELQKQVEQMLENYFQAGSFLETPAPGLPKTIAYPQETVGKMVGPYKLLEKLGEGGMGTVWVAEREKPVRQRVALKLIKPGMDSAQVLRRFEAERQALALMTHHNIARMLDAGSTEAGRPYFVMELVKGVPITKYCDEEHASIEERLKLFIPVCLAVQHAHQKGIIHRDIKPSNVLVCMEDGQPVPKVIDFGVAKALYQPLTEGTLHTAFNQIVGTLEYMSPEQAELNALDIDTRADIYALGVLLFELLTGSTPITREELKTLALMGMLRKIKESEPKKPSTRLSESKDTLASVAAIRRTDPAKLLKEVRRDLDWIVMKCLETDRSRRYETASAVVREIERTLNNEPIEARPPSWAYRTKKFISRYRRAMAVTTTVLIVLIAGIVGTTVGMVQAREAWEAESNRANSEREAKIAAQLERDEKEQQRSYAQAITNFVLEDFLQLPGIENEMQFGGEAAVTFKADMTARQLLELAADKLKLRQGLAKRTEADLYWAIGMTYQGLGDGKLAIPFLLRYIDLLKEHYPQSANSINQAYRCISLAYSAAGLYDKALRMAEEAYRLDKTMHGEDHYQTISSLGILANCYFDLGEIGRAIPLAEEALRLKTGRLGPDHPKTLMSMRDLAHIYREFGQIDQALQLAKEALRLGEIKLTDNNRTLMLTLRDNLAACYIEAGLLDESQPLIDNVHRYINSKLGSEHPLAIKFASTKACWHCLIGNPSNAQGALGIPLYYSKTKLGAEHDVTLTCQNILAECYLADELPDKALAIIENVYEIRNAKYGAEHHNTLKSMNTLVISCLLSGQLDRAVRVADDVMRLSSTKLGANHPTTLKSMSNLALCYQTTGKHEQALTLFEKTLQLKKIKLGRNHPETLNGMNNLAQCYRAVGQIDRAIAIFQEARELSRIKLRESHPLTLTLTKNVADCFRQTGMMNDALRLYQHSATVLETTGDFGSLIIPIRIFDCLATCYEELKQFDQAEPWIRKSLALVLNRYRWESSEYAAAQAALGENLLHQKKWVQAALVLLDAITLGQNYAPYYWKTFHSRSLLGGALLGQKKYTEAEPLLLKGYEGMKQREKTIPLQGKIRIPEALERLIQLYEQTNKPAEAAKWKAELEQVKARLKQVKAATKPETPPQKK